MARNIIIRRQFIVCLFSKIIAEINPKGLLPPQRWAFEHVNCSRQTFLPVEEVKLENQISCGKSN